jgi:hypothetical protein
MKRRKGRKRGRDKQIFSAKQFFVAIEATIFRIERRAIEAQRLQSIFTKISMNTFVVIYK